MVSRTSIGPKEAADRVGRSKSAILKAIREGRISAIKGDDGSWHIEPVELFRAYPDRRSESTQTPHTSALDVRNVPPSSTQAETEHLRDLLQRSEKREADLIEERNAWREQAQRLALTDQRAAPQPTPRRGFWSRLFSRQGDNPSGEE
jgi:hypothetical protein